MIRLTITWYPRKLYFFTECLNFKTTTKTKDKATMEVINANIMYSFHQYINSLQ